jgi:hypothetical protein
MAINSYTHLHADSRNIYIKSEIVMHFQHQYYKFEAYQNTPQSCMYFLYHETHTVVRSWTEEIIAGSSAASLIIRRNLLRGAVQCLICSPTQKFVVWSDLAVSVALSCFAFRCGSTCLVSFLTASSPGGILTWGCENTVFNLTTIFSFTCKLMSHALCFAHKFPRRSL